MKTFNLPHGITVNVKDGSGSITSGLKVLEMDQEDVAYNGRVDAIESLVLAHACAGIKVDSAEYLEGLETVLEVVANR